MDRLTDLFMKMESKIKLNDVIQLIGTYNNCTAASSAENGVVTWEPSVNNSPFYSSEVITNDFLKFKEENEKFKKIVHSTANILKI